MVTVCVLVFPATAPFTEPLATGCDMLRRRTSRGEDFRRERSIQRTGSDGGHERGEVSVAWRRSSSEVEGVGRARQNHRRIATSAATAHSSIHPASPPLLSHREPVHGPLVVALQLHDPRPDSGRASPAVAAREGQGEECRPGDLRHLP